MRKNLFVRAAILATALAVSMIVAIGFGSVEISTGIVIE